MVRCVWGGGVRLVCVGEGCVYMCGCVCACVCM